MLALAGLAGTAFKAPNGIRASAVGMRASRMQMSTYATFKTSKGDFKAELFMDTLPITSSNFADLSKTGFYDGLPSTASSMVRFGSHCLIARLTRT